MVAGKSGLFEGRRVGKASAKEFAVVTGTASLGALVLALMFGSAGQASPGTGGASPTLTTAVTASASAARSSTTTTIAPTTSAAPSPTSTTPAEVTTIVTEVVALPFASQSVDDSLLEQGRTFLRTAGQAGSKTVTWTVRSRGGVDVSRVITGEQVTAEPVDEVTVVGTKAPAAPPAPKTTPSAAPKPTPTPSATKPPTSGQCDPNYAGACVPIATDVDCEGGKGNGPAYVRGPVEVVGKDIYGLDADHDGIGCED